MFVEYFNKEFLFSGIFNEYKAQLSFILNIDYIENNVPCLLFYRKNNLEEKKKL